MSKFHKTFKNEFILNDDYQGILNGGNKINFKYTSFERGHLKFVGESGILYNISGGDVRDGKWKLFKNEKMFTTNGWI